MLKRRASLHAQSEEALPGAVSQIDEAENPSSTQYPCLYNVRYAILNADGVSLLV